MFSYRANINKILQTQIIDLIEICNYVDVVRKTFEDIRNDKEFLKLVPDSKEFLRSESLK